MNVFNACRTGFRSTKTTLGRNRHTFRSSFRTFSSPSSSSSGQPPSGLSIDPQGRLFLGSLSLLCAALVPFVFFDLRSLLNIPTEADKDFKPTNERKDLILDRKIKKLSPCPLSPQKWTPFQVQRIVPVSDNTFLIRFKLPEYRSLNLPVASCVLFRAPSSAVPQVPQDPQIVPQDPQNVPQIVPQDPQNSYVVRPYTPISSNLEEGYFDFVIKHYPNGKMGSYLHGLKAGDMVEMKGPFVKMDWEPNAVKELVLIGGGSGLTPMVQVMLEVLDNPEDKTKMTFLFANSTEKDILMHKQLEELAAEHSEQLSIHYVVSHPAEADKWTGFTGFVSADILKKTAPGPSEDVKVLVCGPPGMMKAVSGEKKSKSDQGELQGLLKEMGYTSEQVFKF